MLCGFDKYFRRIRLKFNRQCFFDKRTVCFNPLNACGFKLIFVSARKTLQNMKKQRSFKPSLLFHVFEFGLFLQKYVLINRLRISDDNETDVFHILAGDSFDVFGLDLSDFVEKVKGIAPAAAGQLVFG